MMMTNLLIIVAVLILLIIYIVFCLAFYFTQEKYIFKPDVLSKDYSYALGKGYEELYIRTKDNKALNALLFKVERPKGLVFYLHGNAKALNYWGYSAPLYKKLGYDVFILDYRGFGKSEGKITNQKQLFQDVQIAYDEMKKRYDENKIVLIGFSLGTGIAAYLASVNKPSKLIMLAPYYDYAKLIQKSSPIRPPRFLVKYKLETYKYLRQCKMPVIIFHGDKDEIIDYSHAFKLSEKMKDSDQLIILEGESHYMLALNAEYKQKITKILS